MDPEKITALIPAYNEEKHLGAVLASVKEQIPNIIVVDDGSADRTAEVAREAGVCVLSRGYNCGKGQSLKDGFAKALEDGYSAVIMLDADGQHDPARIPAFIETYQKTRNRLIIGQRDYAQIPLRRRIPNVIGRSLFSLAVGQFIPDNQSGFRLLNDELMRLMLKSKENGFQFEVEMIALCIANDWPIGWVPIPTIYGDEKSKQSAWKQITTFPKICLQARKLVRAKRKERYAAS